VSFAYPFHDRLKPAQTRLLDELAAYGLSRTIRGLD
jgi:hypothetical protein